MTKVATAMMAQDIWIQRKGQNSIDPINRDKQVHADRQCVT